MKISAINHQYHVPVSSGVIKKTAVSRPGFRVLSLTDYNKRDLSFCGGQRNKEQVVFIGAESAPYSKAGGVGTVMKDYRSYTTPQNQVEIIPYYGAQNVKGKPISPLKDKNGNYIMPTPKGNVKLDLVKKSDMQWGKEEHSPIMLFKKQGEKNPLTYFVFSDDVSCMKKPYESTYVYRTGGKQENNGWNGDPYAKFSKAAVEFLPDVIEDKAKINTDFNPETVVCSDAQTAYVVEYLAQGTTDENRKEDYEGLKPTYVGHNLGPGYCGETSMQNMFVNLGATPEQIKTIENDPIYQDGIKGDNYFKPFVKETLDETGTASAVEIPLHWADKGFVKSFSVVSEDYAESIANNPQTAHNIHNSANQLYEKGVFNGILNPLNDPSVDPSKKLPNEKYNEDCEDTNGKIYPKFEIYPKNPTYEEARKIKNSNKLSLLERLSAKDTTIITGNPNKTARINPENSSFAPVREDLINLIKEGKGDSVPLFVSWGRNDAQKGHNITLDAFEKFAKTKEGKNAILIIGSELDKGAESKLMAEKVQSMLQDPELQGRVVHIDGWAPAYALASAADAAIFSSRFEPCGLTDLEAMKYYCTPIVTNTQGLKQKNFDPRNNEEKDKATSYKTQHEYNLLKSQVEPIIAAYVNNDASAIEKVKKEFPAFITTNSSGKEVYDDKLFKQFAKDYKKYIEEKQEDLPEDKKNTNWKDWDELSKDYSFKFGGCARDLKDGILTQEMAEAIKSCVNEKQETKELIFNNLKQVQTGWKTNSSMHPDGKSSYELYKEHHLESEYTEPNKEDVLAANDKEIKDEIEQSQKKDIEKRAKTYGTGALSSLAALLIGKGELEALKAKNLSLKEEVEALKDAAEAMKKSNNKKLIIVGIAAAVGAAALTLILTKVIAKKKADKTKLNAADNKQENSNQTNQPAQVANNTPVLSLSFQQFKDSLSNKN